MSWSEPRYDENGRFSVQAMILEVALRGSQIPRWAYYLGISNLKIIDEADTRFEQFMRERLAGCETQLRKLHDAGGASNTEIAESIKDIFGGLVNARVSEGKLTLSDEEIIGNCFVFVFAGHGTVPRLIAASVANLHQWVYDSITSVLGDRIPTFDDYDDLTGVLSCIYEALRLYPAVYMMGKHTARDFTFALPRCDKPVIIEEIFVKKGTPVHLVLIGMLYDPQAYPDPESFKPERLLSSLPDRTTVTMTTAPCGALLAI
ncbi:cytochrome P450 [Sanghuangporus baumii]|uniref:Cytochrome P450 n=1 Tax=Sanghuangporus baumii TaxID=108892 RepID=A0A9Q5NBW1_SANBA|nr:cytochrome P450 [Sanghuangporus baumii]